jgi:MoxR-like ATPase
MTAVTTRPPRGTVSTNLVSRHDEIFNRKDGFLARYNVEREEQIELLGISLVSGLDPLFLGDPGTGKTWMIELLLKLLDGASDEDFFNTLVFKETPADDLLGMRSLPGMKAGRIERLMDGYLPTAVVAYLDEIFKASPTLVNSMLDLFANRTLKVGKTIHDCSQLLCIFASSNELPDREDMLPFRDRFGVTNFVPPVRTPEGRKAVMRIQDEFQSGGGAIDLSGAPKLTLDEVAEIRAEVMGIHMPDPVKEILATCMERWEGKGFLPSMRRQGQMIRGLKARAWTQNRDHVTTDDLILLQHMAWNHPDNAGDAREVVLEFANVFARKGASMREALEPITAELDRIKGEIQNAGGEPSEDHMTAAFTVMRNLRRMKRDAKQEIENGKTAGHDTADLERVLDDVNRAFQWVETTITGADED